MIRQGKIWLAAGLLAIGTMSCFDDPTSGLRGGASQLNLDRAAITVTAATSVGILAYLQDQQGNPLPVGSITWTSSAPSVATVSPDTVNLIPGGSSARAFITGASNQPGVTTVTATAGGFSASLRVTVLPETFPGVTAITGTAGPDTIIAIRPAPQPPDTTIFTAGDTVQLVATATVKFTTASTVRFGVTPAYIIRQNADTIIAQSRAPYTGTVTVTALTYAGVSETGPIDIASLQTVSVEVQRARFTGTATVGNDPNFGANTFLTVTAPAGTAFNTVAPLSGVTIGSASLVVLSRSATTITGILGTGQTGQSLMVTNVLVGGTRVDSLRAGSTAAGSAVTITASNFPGTATTPSGNLIDTVTVTITGAGVTFCNATAAPCGSLSVVTINGLAATVLSRTSTVIKAFAQRTGTGTVSVTRVNVSGTVIPTLSTAASLAITATGEANEPGNQSSGTATAVSGLSASGDSAVIWAAMDAVSDARDYYTFSMPVTGTVSVRLSFFGTGSGNDDDNPDLDVVICTTLSGTGVCGYSQDLISGNAASSLANPEVGTSASIASGTTVFVRTYSYYGTAGAVPGLYRLRIRVD